MLWAKSQWKISVARNKILPSEYIKTNNTGRLITFLSLIQSFYKKTYFIAVELLFQRVRIAVIMFFILSDITPFYSSIYVRGTE